MAYDSPTHLAFSLCPVSGLSEAALNSASLELPPRSTEKHEVQSVPELANMFSGELDLNGFSRPERTPQVFSDTSSCGDAVPQPGSSSQSSSGPFSDAQILYYTLVQNGAISSGFLAEFESLVKNVEMDATRHARNSYRDEVQSAICCTSARKPKNAQRRNTGKHSIFWLTWQHFARGVSGTSSRGHWQQVRGFLAVLSRSKTLGSDKAIGSRPVLVHSVCFIREQDWLKVGWALLTEAANFKRDNLLPVPTSILQGCLQAELLYSASFAILNRLLCSLRFPSTQLLVPQMAHFWTPHSGRSFMPSCTSLLGFEKSHTIVMEKVKTVAS